MNLLERPLTALRNRLRWLRRRRQLELDLEGELRFHLEVKQPQKESVAKARELGNITLIKENSRAVFGLSTLETLCQDVRYGARMLRRNAAVTLVAMLSLALGIGANTAIFSFVNAIILSKLPVADPGHLVLLRKYIREYNMLNTSFSYPFYREIARHNDVFSGLLAEWAVPVNFTASGDTERVSAELVSGSFFRVLGVHASLGRVLTEEDDSTEDAHPVCVISYQYWQSRFGSDANILRRNVLLNGRRFQIVGVTQPGFHGATIHNRYPLQVPMSMTAFLANGNKRDYEGWSWLQILGRLKPGISLVEAETRIDALGHRISEARMTAEERRREEHNRFRLVSGPQGFDNQRELLGKPVLVLMALVMLVLLIACANLANLLLARAIAREKEMAVRLSLGAGRGRLIRQLLIESGMLACMGALPGLFLSWPFVNTLIHFLNTRYSTLNVAIDLRVLLFTAGLTCATALLFGSIPARQGTRSDMHEGLKKTSDGGGNYGRALAQQALVTAQVALSMILLFGAGLFLRTLRKLETVDLGFRPEHMLVFSLNPTMSGYKSEKSEVMLDELLGRIRRVPRVEAATIAAISPLSGQMMAADVAVRGFEPPAQPEPNFNFNYVGGDYFHTMETPLLLGRDFNDHDSKVAPKVAIVNEQFVSYIWPQHKVNPIGQRFKWGGGIEETIVGVVKNARYQELREKPQIIVYLPLAQQSAEALTVLVRTLGEPEQIQSAMLQVVHGVDAKLPVYDIHTLKMQVAESISRERVLAFLSTLFGALATCLAGIGVYGVMAYSVTSRTHEIGIRLAVGARGAQVAALFLRESMFVMGVGLVTGILIALAGSKALSSLLFGVEPNDAIALATGIVALFVTGFFALLLPLRRAAHVDPVVALRYE